MRAHEGRGDCKQLPWAEHEALHKQEGQTKAELPTAWVNAEGVPQLTLSS